MFPQTESMGHGYVRIMGERMRRRRTEGAQFGGGMERFGRG